jgi:hypothetical protein
MRPLLAQVFGFARPVIEGRLQDEIRALVRQIADGDPLAPIQIPREGGLPVAAIGVLWSAEFHHEADGRVGVVVRQTGKTLIHLRLSRRGGGWRIVEADAAWLTTVLRDRLVPRAAPTYAPQEGPRN